MKKVVFPDKICKHCKKPFNRTIRISGRIESADEFRKRKFCSTKCSRDSRPKIDLSQLTVAQAAYLAGIFDGEGSVLLRRQSSQAGPQVTYSLSVTVACGTHKPAMDKISAMVGDKTVERYSRGGNRRLAWRVRLHANQAKQFLALVTPFLLIKKKHAGLGIRFQNQKPSRGRRCTKTRMLWEASAKKRLTKLNARGLNALL